MNAETGNSASLYFISGGCRSGKSRVALQLAEQCKQPSLFIATAYLTADTEMQKRIEKHQKERKKSWDLYELPQKEGVNLAKKLPILSSKHTVVLIDCLSLWLSNCMESVFSYGEIESHCQALIQSLLSLQKTIILVSLETGMGLSPLDSHGRDFRDKLGLINQQCAQAAHVAAFIVSGLPLFLKGSFPQPLPIMNSGV